MNKRYLRILKKGNEMKILQVTPFFSPKFGGSVTVLYQITSELAKKGHHITILTSDFGFDDQYTNDLKGYGVKVIPFRTIINFGYFIYTPSINMWLRENIKDFDVIHIHNFRSYQNNCCLFYAIENNIPVIVQAHGTVLPFFEKQGLKKIYDLVWGKKILQYTSKAIALTDIEANQYLTMGVLKNKIEVIPNGLDLLQFSDLPKRGGFRSKYGISDNEKIILFLGRIHKIKGIDLLINAYADLVREAGDVRLVIAGPDENYLSVITNQINALNLPVKPLFTGPVYGRDKLSAYVDADIFVLPSRYEAFPMTLLEAMVCGTPVIVSDNCGCEKMLENAGCGSIVNFTDIQDFTCQARKVLNDPVNSKKAALEGQRYIRNNFGWDRIIHNFEVLYAECGSDGKKN
jgi:glycosyltransferase involved in cell wall biosynthesis